MSASEKSDLVPSTRVFSASWQSYTCSSTHSAWRVGVALALIVCCGSAPASPASQKQAPATAITILDQNGRPVPNVSPSATSQIFDVSVGPMGNLVFSPSTSNIAVGDTVRWTWASSFHSVTSGNPCSFDSQFCSPNDTNCGGGVLSNVGAVYQHTFTQPGTYSYFCAAHCEYGMMGVINVASACTSPPSGMVAWWPGDGNARDIQGGHNGTLQGGATFAPGEVGQAFSFNASTNSGVVVPSAPVLNPTDAITIDAWVNPSSFPNTAPAVVRKDINNVGTTQYDLDVGTGVTTGVLSCSIGGFASASGGSVPLNQWSHVACTYDRQNIRIYINGVEVGSAAQTQPIPTSLQNLVIGKEDGFTDRNFDGLIDEVEVFDRALSQPEIAAMANAGTSGKCKPPQPTTAFSRKTHGGAGTFDIDLMPGSTPGVECRSGGVSNVYQMIIQFSNPVTITGATLLSGSGSVSGFSVAGAAVTIDLSNVANVQTLVVKLTGVNDGTLSGDVPVAMSVLLGDTNGNGSVSASDIGQTKGQSGQTATGSNFRTDVNASGGISAADVGLVKSKSGTSLPP